MSTFTPLRDRVLVQLASLKTPTDGTIQLVRFERQPSTRATVVAVGNEVTEVSIGDHVIISRLQGIEVSSNGLLVLPARAVLATEPEDEADAEPEDDGERGDAAWRANNPS